MRKQHNIIDLSIAIISLFSILFHFIFPNAAIAAGINKKNTINFDYSNSTKPHSVAIASNEIRILSVTETKKLSITKEAKINYPVSAVVATNSDKIFELPVPKPGEHAATNTTHEEFTDYIANDRYINVEKDAMLAAGNVKVISKKKVLITAYSSTPDQTDSSPLITAAGTHVHDGIVAANFLPFGTKVRMPAIYPNKIFTVEDRMKSNVKMDIWFSSRQEAMNFGAKVIEIEIIENL